MNARARVLVIGGNGFIGSVVVRLLVREGYAVRCLLRAGSSTRRIDGLPWERRAGDVRDAASVRAAAEGCAAVLHLASPSSWGDIDSPLMRDVVVGGTRNVLEAVRGGGARIVFVSSILAVNGSERPERFNETSEYTLADPSLRYSVCKREAEGFCRDAAASGQPVVVVNPAEVYGPEDTSFITAGNLVDFARSRPVFVCHGGTGVVHVEDVALGIVRAMERGRAGERYILAGDNLTVRELAKLALSLLGRRTRIVTVPNALLKSVAWGAGAMGIPLPFNAKVLPYATRYWFVSGAKAERELGIRFRRAPEAVGSAIEWLREAGHVA